MNSDILLVINGWAGKSQLLDGAMIFCASYLVYFVILAAVVYVAYALYKRQWSAVVYFVSALAVTFIILELARFIPVDHRPFMDHRLTQLIAHEPGKSFPSDHTTLTSAIAVSFLFFSRYKKLGFVLFATACLIGFSRVFVGVHYPADIVGGVITALLGGGIVYGGKKLIEKHFRSTSAKTSDASGEQ